LTVVGGALGFAIVRWPRLGRAALLVAGSILFVWLETMPTRGKPWLRFAVDLTLLGACGAAAEGLRAKSRSHRVVLATLVALAVAAPLGVLVRSTRLLIHEYGAHGSALIAWVAKVSPRRTSLGNVACANGERPPSALVGSAPASKAAAGADVLFLSFDAMRWDFADAVSEVWRELGPHVRFTRALSPASRTENAYAALLRGVPTRLANGREAALRRPTLAEILVGHGYRAVQVPTHFYFGPGRFQNAGFELAFTAEFPKKRGRIVPADSALRKALEIAKTTPKSLFLSVHLMESHDPYRWNGGQGPPTPAGQRRAFRELDGRAAAFLRQFRRERGSRPLVVAIFGDHGEEFGEHGGAYHSSSVYAEQVRVAFVLSAPGVPETSVAAPVSLASLPATVVDLLGLDAAQSFTEPSLLGCLVNRADCPTVAVSEMLWLGSRVGYTFERHRLVVDPEHDLERLYDSEVDPLEQNDLFASEPALLDALRERARRFDRERCVP
jgi:membrane-anchored protein YejM (alkaline phosphatase superfamily)